MCKIKHQFVQFMPNYRQYWIPPKTVLSSYQYLSHLCFAVNIFTRNLTLCVLCIILQCVMTNEMHNSYNQFYSTIFCLLYMFRTNLVVHHQKHGIIYCITQYNRYNRAYSHAPDDERLDSFETCRADKKLWYKIDHKNCPSRWPLTHFYACIFSPTRGTRSPFPALLN